MKEAALKSITNRFAYKVRKLLIMSNKDMYTKRLSDGTVIEVWQLINRDIKVLERKTGGRVPSSSGEVRKILQGHNNPAFTEGLDCSFRLPKTAPRNPYKQMWESHNVKYPRCRAQQSSDNSLSSVSTSFDQDLQTALDLSLRENDRVPVIKGSEKTRSDLSNYSLSTLAEVAANMPANMPANMRHESSV